MTRYLVDTDVLIDHEKGVEEARRFLQAINRPENQLFLSVITLTELYAGLPPEERRRSEPLISCLEMIVMDRRIAEKAASYLHQHQKKYGMGLGDAVIAATAHHLKANVVTRNYKHFPMTDIRVIVPYP